MSASFVAYIDESGDEGFKFAQGSSEWFVLSAAIIRKRSDVSTSKLIEEVRSVLKCSPTKVLHFRDLKHEQRIPYVERISTAQLRTVSICVHKPSILEPETFQEERHRLYRYIVRYLLERVSWFCRDNHDTRFGGDGCVEIVFSNRAGMSYDEIRQYLRWLKVNSERLECRIHWPSIDITKIETHTPSKRLGLQIADAVATSTYYGVNPSRFGHTEPRYIIALKPATYRRSGKYVGYGIKFWPKEVQRLVDTEASLRWVKDNF
jgi:Protein of unknown function (DUF3800)